MGRVMKKRGRGKDRGGAQFNLLRAGAADVRTSSYAAVIKLSITAGIDKSLDKNNIFFAGRRYGSRYELY